MVSSSEDEVEKDDENISPYLPTAVNSDSSQEAGLAKVFLDDEAEEEDDSDHDLLRFQDNEEEDDESDADEVLKYLIATNYEEASVDQQKRNLLHQKWLEQQDAAGIDDILQRLKYGPNQKMPNCLDDEDDCDNFGDESEDEKPNDQEVRDNARSKSKKAKHMIVHMFNDETDVYEHSDDEAAEQAQLRHRMLKKIDSSAFISPLEDEHSREVFDLIKKTNSLPLRKKKGKL